MERPGELPVTTQPLRMKPYCSDTVTPVCVFTPPMLTASGTVPAGRDGRLASARENAGSRRCNRDRDSPGFGAEILDLHVRSAGDGVGHNRADLAVERIDHRRGRAIEVDASVADGGRQFATVV